MDFDVIYDPDVEFDPEKEERFALVKGEPGGHYTPVFEQVDEEHVRVSFVPSVETLPEVEETILELPQGPKGDAYILTDADKTEIAEEAAELIEVGEFGETDPTVPSWAKQPNKPTYTAAEVGALPSTTKIPSKPEDVGAQPAGNYLTAETDPTVPNWAKQPNKPTYNATEVGALPSTTKIPSKPEDIGAQPVGNYLTAETDPTVPSWAKQPNKPSYTASEVGALPNTTKIPSKPAEVGADPAGTAGSAVSAHNTNTEAHNDMRLQVQALADRLNAFFDSDDTTLDELSEIVAYIKSNKTLIDAITTSKVNVSDIVDNLITNVANKPLSAAQGVVLKGLIDTLNTAKLDTSKLQEAIDTALAQAKASGEFDGEAGVYYGRVADAPSTAMVVVDPDGEADKVIEDLQESVERLSEEIDDLKGGLTLGYHTDGMMYIFVNGSPIGNGVEFIGNSGDVIGYVDSANNIVLTGSLADGEYSLKYENEDGSKTDIGTLKIGSTYTNLIPTSIDASGNIYNGKGYKTGVRLNSSATEKADKVWCMVTGFIPVKKTDVMRIYYWAMGKEDYLAETGNAICLYNSSFTLLTTSQQGTSQNLSANGIGVFDDATDIYTVTISDILNNDSIAYARISNIVTAIENTATDADAVKVIVTINEEIA